MKKGTERIVRGLATVSHPGQVIGKVYRTQGGFYRAWTCADGCSVGPFSSEAEAESHVRTGSPLPRPLTPEEAEAARGA